MRTTSRPGRVLGPIAVRTKRTASSSPSNSGCLDLPIRRHEFSRREIGDETFETLPEKFRPLHVREAAIPIRKPLRRDGGKRGKDADHQDQRDEHLDQREARLAVANAGVCALSS